MTITDLTDLTTLTALGDLEPVGLDELVAVDDLQIRRDRKYLVPLSGLDALLGSVDAVGSGARVLTIGGARCFRYESVYFDTVDLDSYLGAARRRPRRFKVRTRSYLDTAHCMLEVKTRDARGRTVKHRHPYDIGYRTELTPTGQRFVASIAHAAATAHRLHPTLTTTYRRATIHLARTTGTLDAEARVTIDVELAWQRPDGCGAAIDHLALIETKTPGKPCAIDRILWHAGHRPVGISKYGTGLAALRSDLPANKWNRVLRHHFDRHPTRPA